MTTSPGEPFRVARHTASYRAGSEDRVGLLRLPGGLLFVLADGAGGLAGAAEAASGIVLAIDRRFFRASAHPSPEDLSRALTEIDRELAVDPQAGQATAIIGCAMPGRVYGVSAGDSQCWLVSDVGSIPLTAHQPERPFVGSGHLRPHPFTHAFHSGTLLVASDGLFNYLDAGEIIRLAATSIVEDVGPALEGALRRRHGNLPDDLSIIVARPRDD